MTPACTVFFITNIMALLSNDPVIIVNSPALASLCVISKFEAESARSSLKKLRFSRSDSVSLSATLLCAIDGEITCENLKGVIEGQLKVIPPNEWMLLVRDKDRKVSRNYTCIFKPSELVDKAEFCYESKKFRYRDSSIYHKEQLILSKSAILSSIHSVRLNRPNLAFHVSEKYCAFVNYEDTPTRSSVHLIDVHGQKLNWSKAVWGEQITGTTGPSIHQMQIRITEDYVIVFSASLRSIYIDAFHVLDGRVRLRASSNLWGDLDDN